MLTRISNINKLLLKRLALLWLVASVVIGGLVFYFEIEAVDGEVVALGMKQAYSLDQALIERLPLNDNNDDAALQKFVDRMTEQYFMIAEIYNNDKAIRAEAVRHDNKKVEDIIDEKHHKFPLDQKRHYKKFYIGNVMYIQLLVPLTFEERVHGYFEGVYKVERSEINEIMGRLYHTLLIVLIIILATFVMLYPVILYLNRKLINFSKQLFKANIELMQVMGSAIAKRDSVTDSHNYRVTLYAARFGEFLKLDPVRMRDLIAGAFLHDVGKIGIEDDILRKHGSLDEKEHERMEWHVRMGIEIISKAEWLRGACQLIEFHHEKYDGSGYLRGLNGKEIPLIARMFAIIDVFDALCSERPYKDALSFEKALQIMRQQRGKHFDPELLDKFFELAPRLYKQIGQASYSKLTRMLSVTVHKHLFNARLQ